MDAKKLRSSGLTEALGIVVPDSPHHASSVALGYGSGGVRPAAKEQYTRFEQANVILQACTASDAIVCGELICVNTYPNGKRQGDKRQYRQALPRAQK
ncbi:hypothetical protein [Xanthomonas theicola]|uniref:hypothetical protein n=1 Tax=Xanthomonas theicola TaxID=56464 RepID=UPI000FF88FAE|nr:hypothetical protein [Xanthomonas theicola]QNH24998.1 hypothetical protein G4Q83_09945 [Xanthomonas theicola]